MLKFKEKTYKEVDYYDLEELINKTYNKKDFSIVVDLELGNDSYTTMSVEKEEIDEYDKGKLIEFKNGNDETGWMTSILMTDMCNKDIIPEGEYLIHTSW